MKPAKPMYDSLRRKVWSTDNGAIRKDGEGMAVEQLVPAELRATESCAVGSYWKRK